MVLLKTHPHFSDRVDTKAFHLLHKTEIVYDMVVKPLMVCPQDSKLRQYVYVNQGSFLLNGLHHEVGQLSDAWKFSNQAIVYRKQILNYRICQRILDHLEFFL